MLEIEIPDAEEMLNDLKRFSEILSPFITDTTRMLWKALDDNKKCF